MKRFIPKLGFANREIIFEAPSQFYRLLYEMTDKNFLKRTKIIHSEMFLACTTDISLDTLLDGVIFGRTGAVHPVPLQRASCTNQKFSISPSHTLPADKKCKNETFALFESQVLGCMPVITQCVFLVLGGGGCSSSKRLSSHGTHPSMQFSSLKSPL